MIYPWAVIGAGPAGIAAVGMLLDSGVSGQDILWIDPEFAVGDFGKFWSNVPGNTKVGLFHKFLHACQSFSYRESAPKSALHELNPDETCTLKFMVEPLNWVTRMLQTKVVCMQDFAEKISLDNNLWQISLKQSKATAQKVILAVGCAPRELNLNIPVISLYDAMDTALLKTIVNVNDTVGVFGSSHSAILALRHLVEAKVKKIINFYRSPLLYAEYFEDFILYDDTGLKGPTAEWAREYLDGNSIDNLERIQIQKNTELDKLLAPCDKVIYAIGFERRQYPVIENSEIRHHSENDGILAPGLFGVGIAYPETAKTGLNAGEQRVGLWKFIEYLQSVFPRWLN